LTHDDAFLASIIESPDDDVPRLIYADWLEEHGQPERAEFIRVQCQLARMGEDDPRRAALEELERALLKQHQGDWAGPLPAPGECVFHRGFLAELDLTYAELGDAGAAALARSGHLATLEVLTVAACGIEAVGAQALFASPLLRSLSTLHLTGNRLAEADVPALFAGWQLFRLTELSLQGTFIDVQDLAGCRPLTQLQVLDLSENDLRINDEDVAAWASSPHVSGLTSLNFGYNKLGVDAARALAASPHLGRLTTLDFRGNSIEVAGVQALLSSRLLGQLWCLDVSLNYFGDAGAGAVASCAGAARLSQLNLAYNRIGHAGARALATSPHLVGLTSLDLSNNNIGKAAKQGLRERFGDLFRL
jgi:uncharacterized protein (TIGR02996 family)